MRTVLESMINNFSRPVNPCVVYSSMRASQPRFAFPFVVAGVGQFFSAEEAQCISAWVVGSNYLGDCEHSNRCAVVF